MSQFNEEEIREENINHEEESPNIHHLSHHLFKGRH